MAMRPSQAAAQRIIAERRAGAGLQSYEIPRDFIVETTPFSLENGLLTGIRKLAWPKLKEHYGPALEQLYADLADGQADELRALRQGRRGPAGAGDRQPGRRCAARGRRRRIAPDAHVHRSGWGFVVGVDLWQSAGGNLRGRGAGRRDRQPGHRPGRHGGLHRGAARRWRQAADLHAVHGENATEVRACDLTLDKFLDAATLAAAPSLPGPSQRGAYRIAHRRNRIPGPLPGAGMAGADGSGRRQGDRLVRAKYDEEARARLDATFDTGDPKLFAHYRALAADHLEVIAGDKGEANLGLGQEVWQRLADTVDVIVDPAALVNHVLPYSELFGPNALGTAELIRIALTTGSSRTSTSRPSGSVTGSSPASSPRTPMSGVMSATRSVDDSYANGYGNSKWAGEVLLREANDLCGLPVSVFRCDMILADTTYAGQLNLPDMFTRMMFSLVATGIAPRLVLRAGCRRQAAGRAL